MRRHFHNFHKLFQLEDRITPAQFQFAPTSDGSTAFDHLSLRDDRIAVRFQAASDLDRATGYELVRWLDGNTAVLEGQGPLPDVQFAVPVLVHREGKRDTVAVDELIVALKPGVVPEEFFASERFASYRPVWGATDQFVATLLTGRGLAVIELASTLKDDPRVHWSEANYHQDFQLHFNPNDPEYASGNMWHHVNVGQNGGKVDADTDTDLAWDLNPGGSANRLIAVVDDGLETNHPDLNPWVNPGETAGDGIDNDKNGYIDDVNGWNFFADNNVTITTVNDRHGTSVAGVAAAKGNNGLGVVGPSYNARVLIARIFENGKATSDANIASAVYYAAGRNKAGTGSFANVDVMNNSWGGGGYTNVVADAFNYTTTGGRGGLGTITTISSGNGYAGAIAYPALLAATNPGLIAVGGSNNKGERSDYANFGFGLSLVAPTSDLRSNYLGINTTDRVGGPGYNATDYTGTGPGSFGGTSASGPLVAGIAGLVLSQAEAKGVNLTALQMRALLQNGTDLIGSATYDLATGNSLEFGRGRINAFTSVDGVGKPEISVVSAFSDLASGTATPLGEVLVGGSTTQTFRIRNAGTSDLNLSNLIATSAKNSFNIDASFGSSVLKLGEATTFTVRFAPTGIGADTGAITFTSNDANEGSFTLNFTGTGVAASASGRTFEDWNGNGVLNSNDPGVAGRVVFLDANANAKLDRVSVLKTANQAIPDNNANGIASTLDVSGVTVPVRGLTVSVNIAHAFVGDLSLYLVSPDGTALQLAAGVGGAGTSFTNTIFDDAGPVNIERGASPFAGRFTLPFDPLARFDGEDANGTWTFIARDTAGGDVGTLLNWSLEFDAELAVASDSQGRYAFASLPAGTLRSAVPADWTATGTGPDFGSAKNNRAYYRVRHDVNGNGTFEPTEPFLAGRTVFRDANGNGTFEVAAPPSVITKIASVPIPDDTPAGVASTVSVSGLSGTLLDANVTVNVPHTAVGDLRLNLVSPSGTLVTLVNRRGTTGVNLTATTFDDAALVPIANIINIQAPFSSAFQPESPLSALNGQTPNGIWTLQAFDHEAFDVGTISNWSLSLTTAVSEPSGVSAANGNAFVDLPAGTSSVRVLPLVGEKITAPLGGSFTPIASGAPIPESTFGLADGIAPTVALPLLVNDGSSQRSIVSSVRVDFSERVVFSGAVGNAFAITGPGGSVPFTAMLDDSGAFTKVRVSFASLADGKYTLSVNAGLIADTAQNPLAPTAPLAFHRLLGDFNGDATVDGIDFGVFGNTFGVNSTQASFFAPADFNSDNLVDAGDFADLGNRFGITL